MTLTINLEIGWTSRGGLLKMSWLTLGPPCTSSIQLSYEKHAEKCQTCQTSDTIADCKRCCGGSALCQALCRSPWHKLHVTPKEGGAISSINRKPCATAEKSVRVLLGPTSQRQRCHHTLHRLARKTRDRLGGLPLNSQLVFQIVAFNGRYSELSTVRSTVGLRDRRGSRT